MFLSEKLPRHSGIERIVGVELEREKEILGEIAEIFSRKEVERNELPKTPEQRQIIGFLGEALPQFAGRYGARPLSVGENQIVLEKATLFRSLLDKARTFLGYQITTACYAPKRQRIYYFEEKGQGNAVDQSFYFANFAYNLTHEILHLLSFQSAQVVGRGNPKKNQRLTDEFPRVEILELRRMGLATNVSEKRKNKYYFSEIDEGIIELLADKFFSELDLKMAPEILRKSLEKQSQRRLRYLESLSFKRRENVERYFGLGMLFESNESSSVDWKDIVLHRPTQRIIVLDLIDELYEKNKFLFTTKDEVFDIFAKAVMTGRLLPLARLIEKTYGKGSFREIGEKTAEIIK